MHKQAGGQAGRQQHKLAKSLHTNLTPVQISTHDGKHSTAQHSAAQRSAAQRSAAQQQQHCHPAPTLAMGQEQEQEQEQEQQQGCQGHKKQGHLGA